MAFDSSPKISQAEVLAFMQSLAERPRQTYVQDPPTEVKEKHPMLNPAFWFFFAATGCLLLAGTTFVEARIIEHLWFGGVVFNLVGLVLYCSGDREHVNVFHIHAEAVARAMPSKPISPLRAAQIRLGLAKE